MAFFQNLIVAAVQAMPKSVVGFFSRKYIAGETLSEAVDLVKRFNSEGILATMDVLGESISTKEEAISAKNEALVVLDTIKKFSLKANLSIKPTQMGLGLDTEFGYQQIKEIVSRAKEYNNFVRIDMEDTPYTDRTIELFKRLKEEFDGHVGIVVQAYLKRTYEDVMLLNKLGTSYRLCKGIYIEPANLAYKDRQKIRDNYLQILEQMLKNGNYVGIATHDVYLIDKAYEMVKALNIPKDKFEFQMLLGVREDLRNKINKDGYKIRIYVPFGHDWYRYSIRRLKENPQVAMHIFKAIFGIR